MSASCSYLYISGLRFREGDVTLSASQVLQALRDREKDGRSVPTRLARLNDRGLLEELAAADGSLTIRSSRFSKDMISPSEVLELFSDRSGLSMLGDALPTVGVRTRAGSVDLPMDPEGLVGRRGRRSYDPGSGLAPGRRSPDLEQLASASPEKFAAVALMQVETAPKSFRNVKDAAGRISDALLALQDVQGSSAVRSALRKSPRALAFLRGDALADLTARDPGGMLKVARDVAEDTFWIKGGRTFAMPGRSETVRFNAMHSRPDAAPMLVAQLMASGAYRDGKDQAELRSLFMRTMRRADTVARTAREGERRSIPESPVLALALLSSFPAGSPQRAAADSVVAEMESDYHGFRSSYIRAQAEEVRTFRDICRMSPGASQRVLAALSGAGLGEHDASVLLPAWQGDAGEIKRRRFPQAGLKDYPDEVSSVRGNYVGRGEDFWHSTSSPALVALAVVASHMELPGHVPLDRAGSSPAFVSERGSLRGNRFKIATRIEWGTEQEMAARAESAARAEELQSRLAERRAAREAVQAGMDSKAASGDAYFASLATLEDHDRAIAEMERQLGDALLAGRISDLRGALTAPEPEGPSRMLAQMGSIPAGIGDVLEATHAREEAFYAASGYHQPWDPRPGADNSAVLDPGPDGRPRRIYAIEGTDPALAAAAEVNIDPQHGAGTTGHPSSLAAIQAALTAPLPDREDVLTTTRPDMDSVGAMGVLALRAAGFPIDSEARARIDEIAREDSAATGAWPGPTRIRSADDLVSPLAGVAALASDFKMPLGQRAEILAEHIYYGHAHGAAERREQALYEARRALSTSQVSLLSPGDAEGLPVAKVESKHRLAPKIGYAQAPVVLSVNPEFSFAGGEPHKKWTISKYNDTVTLDLARLRDELNGLERSYGGEGSWGGSSSIIGSPQGAASRIPDAEVEAAVTRLAREAATVSA